MDLPLKALLVVAPLTATTTAVATTAASTVVASPYRLTAEAVVTWRYLVDGPRHLAHHRPPRLHPLTIVVATIAVALASTAGPTYLSQATGYWAGWVGNWLRRLECCPPERCCCPRVRLKRYCRATSARGHACQVAGEEAAPSRQECSSLLVGGRFLEAISPGQLRSTTHQEHQRG